MNHTVVVSRLGAHAKWECLRPNQWGTEGHPSEETERESSLLASPALWAWKTVLYSCFQILVLPHSCKKSPASGAHAFQLDLFSHFSVSEFLSHNQHLLGNL